MGPALSRVLLNQVAAGERPPTIRLSRPGRVVAFGRRDVHSEGYGRAVAAARSAGFEAMERLTGGRAAVYTEGALSLTITTPEYEPGRGTMRRFGDAAETLTLALRELGVDARTGAVPGEYCPGDFSVNSGGKVKLAGIGQRMVKGGAHVGFVIVVSDSQLVRDVLEPVSRELELEWNPDTVGAIAEQGEGIQMAKVEASLLSALGSRRDLRPATLDDAARDQAEAIRSWHRSP